MIVSLYVLRCKHLAKHFWAKNLIFGLLFWKYIALIDCPDEFVYFFFFFFFFYDFPVLLNLPKFTIFLKGRYDLFRYPFYSDVKIYCLWPMLYKFFFAILQCLRTCQNLQRLWKNLFPYLPRRKINLASFFFSCIVHSIPHNAPFLFPYRIFPCLILFLLM